MGAVNVIVQNWDLTLFQTNQLQPDVNSDHIFCKGGVIFVFVLKRAFRSAEFGPILKIELPNLSLTRRFVWGQRRLVQRDQKQIISMLLALSLSRSKQLPSDTISALNKFSNINHCRDKTDKSYRKCYFCQKKLISRIIHFNQHSFCSIATFLPAKPISRNSFGSFCQIFSVICLKEKETILTSQTGSFSF